MPGHSQRRKRKRKRSQIRKTRTLAKKSARRKKKSLLVNRISKLLREAFEKAGDMAALRSPNENVREDAYRTLRGELMKLEAASGIRFVVLEDFDVMIITPGELSSREVYVYTSDGVTKKGR